MTAIDHAEYLATHAAGGWDAVLARWPHYPSATPPLPTVTASIAAHRAVRECSYRTPPTCGCPDSPARCSRPDKAGDRLLRECLACVAHLGPT
jgi:hypothetical protein